ncbi:MAG: hypothetical protein H6978_03545 [Gammaproteobacteria bacterium]|nr:hypothetical protein [Gammaproteobacteria bacterium]
MMSGGEAMIRAVAANGIDTVFGLPGAQIYPLFDAMARMPEMTCITPRHEQGAAYMALGYARATGEPGVFSVVPGPGVLNTTAALCTADGNNAPVICLTGQIPSVYLGKGRGHLHELRDQRLTLSTLTKWAGRIDDPTQTQSMVDQAMSVALSGRRGPVCLEMCWDTMAQEFPVTIGGDGVRIEKPEVDLDAVNQAAALIAKAKRPMIMCGGGAQHAPAEVLALARMLNAPVTALRMGRGVVAEDDALGTSSAAARLLWDDTDLLIGVGSRLELQYMRWGSMMKYEPRPQNGPTMIRIDIDPAEMDRLQPDVGIVADSVDGLNALMRALAGKVSPDPANIERISAAKAKARARIQKVQPQMAYLDVIREVLPRDGIFLEELCQVGFTSNFGFPVYEPRTYISPGYQGTLGFGYPTALGVKVAKPDRAVVSVCGDGGFMFGMPEMQTAAQYGIGAIALVFNNNAYGNVRRDQMNNYGGRLIGADLKNPDFVKLADACGVAGYRVDSPAALKPVLAKAIDDNAPALIEVTCERGSEVSPWEFIQG